MDRAALRLILLGVFLISASLGVKKKQNVDIYSFYINSTVTSRYATTVITSRVANTLNESQEIQFEVKIPKNAFISKFRIGVKEGAVASVVADEEAPPDMSLLVAHNDPLLAIRLKEIELQIKMQAHEQWLLRLQEIELENARLRSHDGPSYFIPAQPTVDVTSTLSEVSTPVHGTSTSSVFDASKDIKLVPSFREAEVDTYFIAFERVTATMRWPKERWTRLALLRILSDLDEDDHFGLITFDSEVNLWKRELLKATEENLKNAKSFVKEIRDRGATDINAAVLAGVDMIKRHPREGTASILILLTDGDPTTGETNIEKIMANVKEAIGTKFPLYCLGFGYDVNFDFLIKMSLENSGVARRIYEDSDADLQLQGFYEEVAVPLLTDIQLKYPGGSNLTKTSFSLYFNGSEIVVSGQITDNSVESFTTEVIAVSKGSNVTYQDNTMTKDTSDVPPENEDFMQRLWAHLTVKQLLDRQVLLKGQEKEDEKKESLKLSLKYQFVTPLTSMVVTKPQEGDVEVANKPKEGERGGESTPRNPGFSIPGLLKAGPSGEEQCTPHHPVPVSPQCPQEIGLSTLLPLVLQGTAVSSDCFSQSRITFLFFLIFSPFFSEHAHILRNTHDIFVLSPKVHSNRFLLPVVGQSKPLCFDVPVPHKLRLLQDSASEFSMNGESLSEQNGFHQIAVHYKTNHHLIISTKSISYHNGQDNVEILWGQELTQHNTDGVSLVVLENEMNVTMGNIGVVIISHKKDGVMFLWPAIWEYPKDVNLTGVLGKSDISYVKTNGSQTPTLKMKDKEVKTYLETVSDYRLHSTPTRECWLVPFQAVMEAEISDFTVTQL
uniref:Zgc:112265 n=1 Tax=Cyprinus carpio TaxID=7962 RepID=A0A8C2KDR4_CYPCA